MVADRFRRGRSRLATLAGVVAAAGVLALAAVVVTSLLGVRSSSPDDPRAGIEADSVRFTYGDRSIEVPLVQCGRDGDVVIMVGRQGSTVVQVAADLAAGGEARTGVTADMAGDGTFGAFGARLPQGPVGEVTSVEVVGDGLVVEGRWAGLDPGTLSEVPSTTLAEGDDQAGPAPGDGAIEGRLVGRCPETDDPSS